MAALLVGCTGENALLPRQIGTTDARITGLWNPSEIRWGNEVASCPGSIDDGDGQNDIVCFSSNRAINANGRTQQGTFTPQEFYFNGSTLTIYDGNRTHTYNVQFGGTNSSQMTWSTQHQGQTAQYVFNRVLLEN